MPPALIQTRDLGKTYSEGSADVHALRGVDLEIQQGSLTVLMGSSGSGKSTLLYLLSGLEPPSRGEIHFCGERLDSMDETRLSLVRRTGIGFVFQAINLVPHLSIFENVVLPGYLVERDRNAVDGRAMALLESMGIAELADRLPAQVSGGEQQRAGIARAMVNSPRALFADEPTGALNSAAGKVVLDSLRRLNAGGQTILMATHEVKAACVGDRILYLRDGEIRSEYRLETDPSVPDRDREADVLAWLAAQGW